MDHYGRPMARYEPANLSPVVIVGTHRSGTSALTGALARLGLHIGARLDENNESTLFQRLSAQLSAEAGGHWTNPEAVWRTIDSLPDLSVFAAPLRSHIEGPGAVEYWGWRQMLKPDPNLVWGWKNPRNTYLLPLWAELFPDLRIVWIRRDPRACAASLFARSQRIRSDIEHAADDASFRAGVRRARRAVGRHPILADGWRGLDPTVALEITVSYAELQERLLRTTDRPVFELQYDDFVAAPLEILTEIAGFAKLQPTATDLTAAAATIRTSGGRRDHGVAITPELERRLAAVGYPNS